MNIHEGDKAKLEYDRENSDLVVRKTNADRVFLQSTASGQNFDFENSPTHENMTDAMSVIFWIFLKQESKK